jgi:hypothetical protein
MAKQGPAMTTGPLGMVLYATVGAMQVSWLFAVLAQADRCLAQGTLETYTLTAFFPAAFLCERIVQRRRWRLGRRIIAGWVLWAGGVSLALGWLWFDGLPTGGWSHVIKWLIREKGGEPAIVLAGSGACWWLGRRLAGRPMRFDRLVGEFQFGLVIFMLVLLSAAGLGGDPERLIPATVIFTLSGLTGMAAAHAWSDTNRTAGRREARWLLILLVSVAGVALLGLAISTLAGPDLMQMLYDMIRWVGQQAAILFNKLLTFLMRWMPRPQQPLEIQPPVPSGPMEHNEWVRYLLIPEPVRKILRSIVAFGWLALFLIALWRLSASLLLWIGRRWSGREDVELSFVPGAFREDLRNLLNHVMRILFRGLGRLTGLFRSAGSARRHRPELPPARRLYRRLLKWAARQAYPRPACRTPYEYLKFLIGLLPEAERELHLITEQYVQARYGRVWSGEEDLIELRRSWVRLKRSMPRKRVAIDRQREEHYAADG